MLHESAHRLGRLSDGWSHSPEFASRAAVSQLRVASTSKPSSAVRSESCPETALAKVQYHQRTAGTADRMLMSECDKLMPRYAPHLVCRLRL